uniref:uncharacterized protein n=1 Tax=Lonchura striata TaxID=40157 RepID=UPI0012939D4D|nr:uncharacterized protein LOC110480646 [Lonchura striata domestica]
MPQAKRAEMPPWARDRGVDLTMDSISQVIHDCETCAAIKQAKRVKPLWYGGRWSKYKYGEAWQIDHITLPQTRQGKRYVLTMVEATTGWSLTLPLFLPQLSTHQLLEAMVAMVATLGKLVATLRELTATVARPHRDVLLAVSPEFLQVAVGTLIFHLQDALRHYRVPSLGWTLAHLGDTPGTTWACVRALASARRVLDRLMDSWAWVAKGATKLRDACRDEATRRGQRLELHLGLLGDLVAACDEATAFPRELQRRLGDIEAALEGTIEVSPDFRAALVATVTEAEQLWEANARLATRHLLGTLGDINTLFFCPSPGHGGRTVAKQCQRAMEDIPRLLCTEQHHHWAVIRPVSPLQRLGDILRALWEHLGTLWEGVWRCWWGQGGERASPLKRA